MACMLPMAKDIKKSLINLRTESRLLLMMASGKMGLGLAWASMRTTMLNFKEDGLMDSPMRECSQ